LDVTHVDISVPECIIVFLALSIEFSLELGISTQALQTTTSPFSLEGVNGRIDGLPLLITHVHPSYLSFFYSQYNFLSFLMLQLPTALLHFSTTYPPYRGGKVVEAVLRTAVGDWRGASFYPFPHHIHRDHFAVSGFNFAPFNRFANDPLLDDLVNPRPLHLRPDF